MSEVLSDKFSHQPIGGINALVGRSHLLMIVATGLVATSFPVGAAITGGMDSLVLTLLRFVLAAILFAPFVIWRYGFIMPTFRDLVRYAILSACLVGFFWGMFAALRLTSVLNTATIFSLTPAITAGVATVLLKEKLNSASKIALGTGIVGAVWVIFRGDPYALLSFDIGMGDGIFFMGTIALGFYGPLVKYLHRGEPMAQITFWTLVFGAVWLLFLSAPRLSEVVWSAVPITVYGGIAYLSVFTTMFTFFVFQWSATVIGPTKVMSYTYLNPVLAVAIGVALGQEVPPLTIYPGLFLTLIATLVLQRSRQIIPSLSKNAQGAEL